MNALDKLREMLNEAKIPYESYQEQWPDKELIVWDGTKGAEWQRNQIIYGRHDEHEWRFDAIFQYGSFGREKNMIETYGDLGTDEDGNPRVMSAETAFVIIKEDWDKLNKEMMG